MQPIEELYEEVCTTPSDIHEHLPTFVEFAKDINAKRVIELGVRTCVSTIAWLYAMELTDGHLWSVDIDPPRRWFGVRQRWTFFLGDDMDPYVIEQRLPRAGVDIVFIDTSHAYQHTFDELVAYEPLIRPGGLVLLHDTEVEWPELVDDGVQFPVRKAIEDYCAKRALTWENRPNCNGLGIIRV